MITDHRRKHYNYLKEPVPGKCEMRNAAPHASPRRSNIMWLAFSTKRRGHGYHGTLGLQLNFERLSGCSKLCTAFRFFFLLTRTVEKRDTALNAVRRRIFRASYNMAYVTPRYGPCAEQGQ